MRQIQAQEEDKILFEERKLKFLGSFSIRLDQLQFLNEVNRKHVKELKRIFRRAGCRPLEERKAIAAVIDKETMAITLRNAGVLSDIDYPDLIFHQGYKLECMHGHHRIQAAREILLPGERDFWPVDLYSSSKCYIILSSLC